MLVKDRVIGFLCAPNGAQKLCAPNEAQMGHKMGHKMGHIMGHKGGSRGEFVS